MQKSLKRLKGGEIPTTQQERYIKNYTNSIRIKQTQIPKSVKLWKGGQIPTTQQEKHQTHKNPSEIKANPIYLDIETS